MVISSPKHKILGTRVFCQGMVVLLSPVCTLLSVEYFMFMRAQCCSFRDLMTSKALASID